MNAKLVIRIIVLILCCILAYLIPIFYHTNDNCIDGVCPPPIEGRLSIMSWIADLAWYWWAAIIGVISYIVWFVTK